MRRTPVVISARLLATTACLQKPAEVVHPRPAEILLQVTYRPDCGPDLSCDAGKVRVRRGLLIYVDGDSLVMADVAGSEQIAVRPGPGVELAIYRGQKMTADAIAKNAAKGGVIGGLVTLATTAALGLIGQAFHPDTDWSVGRTALEAGLDGAVVGAVVGGAKGAANGEPSWQPITLWQLRQQLCRCARPDSVRAVPVV